MVFLRTEVDVRLRRERPVGSDAEQLSLSCGEVDLEGKGEVEVDGKWNNMKETSRSRIETR